jgi:hypothetical protein
VLDSPYYIVGYALIGASGVGVHLSSFHLGNRFPAHRGLVLSLYAGIFNVSGIMFAILNVRSPAQKDCKSDFLTSFCFLDPVGLFDCRSEYEISLPHSCFYPCPGFADRALVSNKNERPTTPSACECGHYGCCLCTK